MWAAQTGQMALTFRKPEPLRRMSSWARIEYHGTKINEQRPSMKVQCEMPAHTGPCQEDRWDFFFTKAGYESSHNKGRYTHAV